MSLDKEYRGTFELGKISNSHDVDGEILETRLVPESIDENNLEEKMLNFIGDQYQTPPMFSAVKVKGVPLYKHARKGKEVEREPRFIRISKFDLLNWSNPFADFYVYCTKGTYIRCLVHDLGEKLGCGAILSGLRRTASNNLSIDQAIALDTFEEHTVTGICKYLIPGYQALSGDSET